MLQQPELSDPRIIRTVKNHTPILSDSLLIADLQLGDKSTRQMKDLVSINIEFCGTLARTLLKSISSQSQSVCDMRLVTAHLDCGMWWRPTEELFQGLAMDHPELRFTQYHLTNFRHLLNFDLLGHIFPDLWSDKITPEQEHIFDLCVTVPSILVILNRFDEAVELIVQCRNLGGIRDKPLLIHGYLDLMLSSIYVF